MDNRRDPTGPSSRSKEQVIGELFALHDLASHLIQGWFPLDPATIDDLIQETLLRFWTHRETITHPRAWFFKILHDLAVDATRIKARERSTFDGEAPSREALVRRSRVDLERLLSDLPDQERHAIEHLYLQSESVAVTADGMGTTRAYVWKLASRARKHLKEIMTAGSGTALPKRLRSRDK